MVILHSKNKQILPYADILVLISIMRVYFIFKISVVFRNKHCSDCSTVQQCITCITVFRYEHMYISKTWTVLENNSNTTSQALMHTRIQIKGSVKKKNNNKKTLLGNNDNNLLLKCQRIRVLLRYINLLQIVARNAANLLVSLQFKAALNRATLFNAS